MENKYVLYFLAGTLGVLLQIFAVKIPSLKKQFASSNTVFKFSAYLADDWYAIVASFVSLGILIVGLDEVLGLKPELVNYVKWMFIFVGYTGSSIIQYVLSLTSKKINAVIDIKTNIADNVEMPINDKNKIGEQLAANSTNTIT